MKSIKFQRTAHTMLNNGIIGLYDYLNKAKKDNTFNFSFDFELSENALGIISDNLFPLLEELYYRMGRDYYDTYTLKQLKQADEFKDCKIFLNLENEEAQPFPKMNTYGLTHLLTNNAAGKPRNQENLIRLKNLEKTNDFGTIGMIKKIHAKYGIEPGQEIYLNEPYTKIPRLNLKKVDFETGDLSCALTGEKVKKLYSGTQVSTTTAFIGGIENFNAHFKNSSYGVCMKAVYLSRFAPAKAFYHYPNKTRSALYIYLFASNTLVGLKDILNIVELTKAIPTLRAEDFVSNIKFENFGKEEKYHDFTEQFEVAFMLIYTFYRRVIKNYGTQHSSVLDDLFGNPKIVPSFSIVSFEARKFAQTMRSNKYINLNRLHQIIATLYYLERNGVRFKTLLPSLKLIKPSDKSSQNSYRLERVLRDNIAECLLKGNSIIELIEDLYVRCYGYICANEYLSFKDYDQIFKFFQLYELKANPMDEQLQQMAIKLGQQIGFKMKNIDKSVNERTNAKNGRGDLISLRKARTMKQFLDELIRIDFKYGLTIKDDLSTKINEETYFTVKQFMIIGALNILNPVIHPYSKNDKNE